jgi:hypothetical protein
MTVRRPEQQLQRPVIGHLEVALGVDAALHQLERWALLRGQTR